MRDGSARTRALIARAVKRKYTGPSAPRRSFLLVSSPDQRSTRFIQSCWLGWSELEAKVGQQPLPDRRRLVRLAVVEHEMHRQIGGDLAIDGLQKLLELDRAMTRVQLADGLPVERSRAA